MTETVGKYIPAMFLIVCVSAANINVQTTQEKPDKVLCDLDSNCNSQRVYTYTHRNRNYCCKNRAHTLVIRDVKTYGREEFECHCDGVGSLYVPKILLLVNFLLASVFNIYGIL